MESGNPNRSFPMAVPEIACAESPGPLRWEKSLSGTKAMAAFRPLPLKLKPWTGSLYVGGTVLGALLAPVGYAVSHLLWDFLSALTHRRVKDDGDGTGPAA